MVPNITGMKLQFSSNLVRMAAGITPGDILSSVCTSQWIKGPVVVRPVSAIVLLRWILNLFSFSIF